LNSLDYNIPDFNELSTILIASGLTPEKRVFGNVEIIRVPDMFVPDRFVE
jgi:hypothetical protein